ncbi:TVP38/TMEM64 family protein [Vibrio sp.]|uniref:TVP38/TMEM64 family protein n=1 Tax=Vibrio sp. TaxID=678 RepID=UPI003D0F5B60
MNKKLIVAVGLLFVIIIAGSQFGDYLTLENAKNQQQALSQYIEQHFLLAATLYFFSYIVIAALSIPGAGVTSLLGAALFGFWPSLVLVSFASTIGATLAFLSSRFLLKDWVQSKFGSKLAVVNQGIKRDGTFYLFTLRLIPVFPFFLINLLMGLTPITALRFYLVSQIGMLPVTVVFLNAGAQLAQIDSLSGILSPGVIASLALVGLFPLIAKWLLRKFKSLPNAENGAG